MTTNKRTLCSPSEALPVLSVDDLHAQWTALMSPLGFGSRQLWFMILDHDGRPTPVLSRIEDLPDVPPRDLVRNFVTAMAAVLKDMQPGAKLGFLLARPGPAKPNRSDRAWMRAIDTHISAKRIAAYPTLLAGDDEVLRAHPPMAA